MRNKIYDILKEKYKNNSNLFKHMLAVEACMSELAKYFNENIEKWQIAGLIHDYDYLETKDNIEKHGKLTVNKFRGIVDDDILHAVEAHPGNIERKNLMDKALFSCDPLTGLIVASTLMHPTRKIENVDVKFVLNRFKEKRFAAGANRESIRDCETMGISLKDFIEICLNGMKAISKEIGL